MSDFSSAWSSAGRGCGCGPAVAVVIFLAVVILVASLAGCAHTTPRPDDGRNRDLFESMP